MTVCVCTSRPMTVAWRCRRGTCKGGCSSKWWLIEPVVSVPSWVYVKAGDSGTTVLQINLQGGLLGEVGVGVAAGSVECVKWVIIGSIAL